MFPIHTGDAVKLGLSLEWVWLMASEDGAHSGSLNVVGKFISHTVQKPYNQNSIFIPRWNLKSKEITHFEGTSERSAEGRTWTQETESKKKLTKYIKYDALRNF